MSTPEIPWNTQHTEAKGAQAGAGDAFDSRLAASLNGLIGPIIHAGVNRCEGARYCKLMRTKKGRIYLALPNEVASSIIEDYGESVLVYYRKKDACIAILPPDKDGTASRKLSKSSKGQNSGYTLALQPLKNTLAKKQRLKTGEPYNVARYNNCYLFTRSSIEQLVLGRTNRDYRLTGFCAVRGRKTRRTDRGPTLTMRAQKKRRSRLQQDRVPPWRRRIQSQRNLQDGRRVWRRMDRGRRNSPDKSSAV